MSERFRNSAAVLDDEVDGILLERENRELASKQVRRINDTLRKVRRISRESQQMTRPVFPEEAATSNVREAPLTDPAPAASLAVEEVVIHSRGRDARRERDDSTDKIMIPEPTLDSAVSEVFKKAFEMFETECAQFRFTRGRNSPVVRSWKLT